MNNKNKILILAPHTDDGEFGCGGAISKWLGEGKQVYYAAFSSAEKSVPEGFPKDVLKKELKKATASLGIAPKNLRLFNFPVREFMAHRQAILETLITLGREINPDIVVVPATTDTHQDHQTISQEGFRAFKRTSIIGYEMPHNNLTFSTNLFITLDPKHVESKIRALKCYKSQYMRSYATPRFVKSLAHVRGVQIGAEYAEVFEVVRWVIK